MVNGRYIDDHSMNKYSEVKVDVLSYYSWRIPIVYLIFSIYILRSVCKLCIYDSEVTDTLVLERRLPRFVNFKIKRSLVLSTYEEVGVRE